MSVVFWNRSEVFKLCVAACKNVESIDKKSRGTEKKKKIVYNNDCGMVTKIKVVILLLC